MKKAPALFVTMLMLLLPLGSLSFIVIPAHAQGSFYTKATTSLAWFNRVSTTPIAVGDDVGQWIDLDPSWMFYCTEPVKLRVYVCSNGFLIFDPTAATNDYTNSLEELKARWKIAPFWDDLRTDVAGGIVTNPGVYVDRDAWKVVITWEATRYGASSDSIRFQAVLWYNGSLWISIKDATNFSNFTPTIGISKGDNTNYYDLTSEGATGRTWKFNISNEIDRALALGKRWLDRMYYEISSTQAVIKDYPGLPLRVYDASNGKWYRSGQLDEKVRIEALSSGNIDEAYYYFNTDSDVADNEPKVYVKYWSANSESMTLYVKFISCDRPDPQNLYVYAGDVLVGNCGSGFEVTINNIWGFASHQYVVRHSTRMAQRFYQAIGDTRRAERLNNFLTAYGYTNRDVYDPLFGASNSYPDDFFTQKTTFPDPELWSGLPSRPAYHPYGTRLQRCAGRDLWVDCVETNTPRYNALYALHLLNKYGSSRLSEAKYWIDRCQWDGVGVRRWVYACGLKFVYAAYPGYTAGPFLAAVAKYASMTGDSQYLQMADRAAGVILMLQWKYPDSSVDHGTLYRADHVGGFKTGYVPGNSMVWNPIWSPVVDQFFWILDRMNYLALNPHEMPGPAVTSSECTIMSLQALRLYKQLLPGRTPNKPGAAPKLNARPADTTYTTGGGIWQASADKKGTLMAKASGGPASWAETAVKYNFIPDADVSNPIFEYATRDRVYLDGLGIGIAISYQYMRFWQGSTKIFEKIVKLHSASGSNYGLWDDSHVISCNYQGILYKDTQYTLEVGYRIEANYGFGSTFPQVDILWVIIESSWRDDFGDNNIDANRWEALGANGGTVNEVNNRLEVTIPSGSGQAQAGYVTKHAYSFNNFSVSVDVPEFDSLDEMALQIALTKTTSSDPFNEPNWYRILKARYDGMIYVQKRVGGTLTTLITTPYSTPTGNLKIAVIGNTIYFYADGQLIYSETYQLSSKQCYIYIFTSTLRSRASGTDAFDDFNYSWVSGNVAWVIAGDHEVV